MYKSKKDILNGNISEQILIFTLPLFGSYLLQQLYQTADSIILGRFAGKVALAAIGASNSIINIILNFITGISAGIMIVLAQNYGRGNKEKAKATVKTGMFVAVVFGGILTAITALSGKTLLELTGCPSEAMNDSLIYLRFYAFSFIPYLIEMTGSYIFRAMGENKVPIILTLIIAISKIGIDIVMTAILKMGIWGVAVSTFASQTICAIVVLVMLSISPEFQFNIFDFGFDSDCLKNIIKIGVPAGVQSMLFAISNLVIQAKINTYGTDTIAAYSTYNSVDNIYWCFANAISSASITLISQNYGNKNMKRVKKIVKHGLIIDLIFTTIIASGVYVFNRQLISLYTTDANVIEIGYNMLKIIVSTYPLYIFIEIISAAMKGCGDSSNSMIITLIGICAVRIGFVLFFPINNALTILYCYPLSWIVTDIIFIIYYLTSKKYKIN